MRWWALLHLALLGGAAFAGPQPTTAASLHAAHERLAPQLAHSAFRRPLLLESSETEDGLQGEIHAVLDHPLPDLRAALDGPAHWCNLLTLHLNNRRCRVAHSGGGAGGMTVMLSVVRRHDNPVEDAFELPFAWRVVHDSREHLAIDMRTEAGPLGTRNYHVRLDAVPLGGRRSFVRFSYAYEHNAMARLATQAYLATFGSHKVGFTVTGRTPGGEPEHIRGLRGLVERNALRYFLALDAHVAAAAAPPAKRRERALALWFDAIEKYPRQLREIDRATYLDLKKADRERDGAPR